MSVKPRHTSIIFGILLTLFGTLLASYSMLGNASQSSLIKAMLDRAHAMNLASDSQWLGLLHYYTPVYSDSAHSYVDDPDFFLSPFGKTDAQKELEATLTGFFAPSDLGDAHPICRFPARFEWLKKQFGNDADIFSTPHCKDYEDWRAQVNATRISLIFPSAYINSPSSMFGHTLFRFDPENVEEGTDWLSWSLSFGAQIDSSDNSIAFAYRGIFGGYPGIYNMNYYFQKIKEYNHLENRDIWEYELDINADQVDEMLSHTWELKDIYFDYYFLDENCAFRLLEQIELVRHDVQLTNKFGMTAIPADTVRAFLDEGLVKSVSYKPSATTTLKHRIHSLSEEEQALAKALSEDINILSSGRYQALPDERKTKVTQVAYSYLRFQQLKIQRDDAIAQRSFALLNEINTLPPEEAPVISPPPRPEQGHKTSMIGASMGIREDQVYTQLHYRPTYHDLLDKPTGYPNGAHIAMGNTELRYAEGGDIALQRFDFIDIISLSEMDRFFHSPSWHVITGYEKVYARHSSGRAKDTGAYYVKAGGGASTTLGSSIITYAFADARLENNSYYKSFITASAGLSGGVVAYSDIGTFKASFESDYFTNDEYRLKVMLEQNLPLGVDNAIRLGAGKEWYRDEQKYQFSVAYRHYF